MCAAPPIVGAWSMVVLLWQLFEYYYYTAYSIKFLIGVDILLKKRNSTVALIAVQETVHWCIIFTCTSPLLFMLLLFYLSNHNTISNLDIIRNIYHYINNKDECIIHMHIIPHIMKCSFIIIVLVNLASEIQNSKI